MWGHSLPPVGNNRVCFTTDGNLAFGPVLIQQQPIFGLTNDAGFWRDGSYWIPGGATWDGRPCCAMLHIPGPNEPLDISENPSGSATNPGIQVYPQPTWGPLTFSIPSLFKGGVTARVYNLLGQQVYSIDLPVTAALDHGNLNLPQGLASGTYLLALSNSNRMFSQRFIILK